MGDHVAWATVCSTTTKTVWLPNAVSIFRAELFAITLLHLILFTARRKEFHRFFLILCLISKL